MFPCFRPLKLAEKYKLVYHDYKMINNDWYFTKSNVVPGADNLGRIVDSQGIPF